MKTKKQKKLMIQVFVIIFMISSLTLFIKPVSGDINGLAIKEGESYAWQVTYNNNTKYPELEVGDLFTIYIDAIEYAEDYAPSQGVWILNIELKPPYFENDDLPVNSYFTIIENGSLAGWVQYFIPNTDIPSYLTDFALTSSNYNSSGNILTYTSGNTISTYEFNDQGVMTMSKSEEYGAITTQMDLVGSSISFGFNFLFIFLGGMVICIIIYKRKVGGDRS